MIVKTEGEGGENCVYGKFSLQEGQTIGVSYEKLKKLVFFTTSSSRASNSNFTDKIQSERKYFLILKTDV